MDIDVILGLIFGSIITFCLTLLFEFILPEKWRIKIRGVFNKIRLRGRKFEVHMEKSYSIENVPNRLTNNISQKLRDNNIDVSETKKDHVKAITSKEPLDKIDVFIDISQNEDFAVDEYNRIHLKLKCQTRFKDLRDALIALKSQEDRLSILFEEISKVNIRRVSQNIDVRLKLENISELLHLLDIIHANRISGEYRDYIIRMNTDSLTVSGPYDPEFEKIIRNILTYC